MSRPSHVSKRHNSGATEPSRTPSARTATLGILTININSWFTFRDKWSVEGQPPEFDAVTVMMLQEHHLTTRELCNDAQEWLDGRGWRAVFGLADKHATGRPSGGVALLFKQSDTLGITDPGLSAGDQFHRLLAVRMVTPVLEPCLVIAAYFEANVGLNATNRGLLSTIAQWQDATQTPVILGADFNVSPKTLYASDFPTRSGLRPVVPNDPTYKTSKTATTLDFFLLATPFADRVTDVTVLKGFPLKPHSPVLCTLEVSADSKTPVLEMPPRLPLQPPFGPALKTRNWSTLAQRIGDALDLCERQSSRREQQQALDSVYAHFVSEMERQVCERTDTPRRMRSRRGRPPRVMWVDPARRCQEHRASWRSLIRPLQWIQSWIQDVLRYISGTFPDSSATLLMHDLEECPVEFRQIPSLIGMHQRAKVLIGALAADESSGATCAVLNSAAFNELYSAVGQAESEEKEAIRGSHSEAWKAWVQEAGNVHLGWAHRWTAVKDLWRPQKASAALEFSGKPLDTLTQERDRLALVWGCTTEPHELFNAPADQAGLLSPITTDALSRAARSFPTRTAQSYDGFHPRHFTMLAQEQRAVLAELLRLVERIGTLPSAIQAVLAKLIPKIKSQGVSYRSISLFPSLYRVWSRCRLSVARKWESANKDPLIGHQSGRSIMEIVFLQALGAESGQLAKKKQHTGFFLWDMANFYEYICRHKLWDRATEMGFSLVVLAVSLNTYAARRFVGLGTITLEGAFPRRGIGAGCPFATTYVQIYSLPPLRIWRAETPASGSTSS